VHGFRPVCTAKKLNRPKAGIYLGKKREKVKSKSGFRRAKENDKGGETQIFKVNFDYWRSECKHVTQQNWGATMKALICCSMYATSPI